MPDWSYHPCFRPLLFRLPPAIARDVTFSALGLLASIPFGLGHIVIETLGQMRIPAGIARSAWGLDFPGPVGLGAGLDVHAVGTAALAHFGFGFLEIGPVTLEPVQATAPIERRIEQQAISYPDLPINDGLIKLSKRLASIGRLTIPVGIRLAYRPGASATEAAIERSHLIEQLGPFADYFALDTCNEIVDGRWHVVEWTEHLRVVVQALQRLPQVPPLLLCLAADMPLDCVEQLLEPAMAIGIKGVIVGCGVAEEPSRRVLGAAIHQQSVDLVRAIYHHWGDRLTIIGEGGIQEPEDALRLLNAGATLVQVHSGLVYSGPGLPKRINEAVKYLSSSEVASSKSLLNDICDVTLATQSWVWMALLGIALLIGGSVAALVALTSVVLPYDDAFVAMSRIQIAEINQRLLPFMTHDRVTLAGTMLSLGILYLQLAIHGIRHGEQWAWLAIVISCLVGFASFFLFLGFDYFDPLHAVLAVILFVYFCLGLRKPSIRVRRNVAPNIYNDRSWLLSQWGQFLFVGVGIGLIVAGLVIATIGITHVFVPEDLAFMHITSEMLHAANSRLIPLIAHDRAGFGGALVSDGLGILLIALWGFHRGARWVWWTLAGAGTSEFLATAFIHLYVGYINLWHLTPTLLAALPYVLGLVLSYPYLFEGIPLTQKNPLQVHLTNLELWQPE